MEEEEEQDVPAPKLAPRRKSVVKKKERKAKDDDGTFVEAEDLRAKMTGMSLTNDQDITSSNYDKRPSVLYKRQPTGVSIESLGGGSSQASPGRASTSASGLKIAQLGGSKGASQSGIASSKYGSNLQQLGGSLSAERASQAGIAAPKFGQNKKAAEASIRDFGGSLTAERASQTSIAAPRFGQNKKAAEASIRDFDYEAERPKKERGKMQRKPAKAASIREETFDKEMPMSYNERATSFSKKHIADDEDAPPPLSRLQSAREKRPGVAVAYDLSTSDDRPLRAPAPVASRGESHWRSAFTPFEVPDEKMRKGGKDEKRVIRLKQKDLGLWIPIKYSPIPGQQSDDIIMLEDATQPMLVEVVDASSQGHSLVLENKRKPIVYSRPSDINKFRIERPLSSYEVIPEDESVGYGRGFVDAGSLTISLYVHNLSKGVEFRYPPALTALIRIQPINARKISGTRYTLITTPFFSGDANDVAKLFGLRLANPPSPVDVNRISNYIGTISPKIQNEYAAVFLSQDDDNRRYDSDVLVLKWTERELRVRNSDVYMVLAEPS